MTRSSRAVDAGRLANMVSRPGIDPRVFLTLAVVTELGYDPEFGPLADVQFIPGGEEETCLLGAPYAGGGFGAFFPPKVDDTVLVAIPEGDPGHGPVVVARMWSGGDRPFAEMQAGSPGEDGEPNPTTDVVLRTEAGRKLRVWASGGGAIELHVEGTGDVTIDAGGQVKLQDASQSFVRGETYADALGQFLTALGVVTVAVGTFATAVGVAVPAVAGAATTLNTAITTFGTAINAFATARATYLSSKVKGQ